MSWGEGTDTIRLPPHMSWLHFLFLSELPDWKTLLSQLIKLTKALKLRKKWNQGFKTALESYYWSDFVGIVIAKQWNVVKAKEAIREHWADLDSGSRAVWILSKNPYYSRLGLLPTFLPIARLRPIHCFMLWALARKRWKSIFRKTATEELL